MKQLEESNVALEELKQQITKQAEELQQKNEFITLLKTKLDYKDEEISDLRSRVDQLGRQSDMWHERFITANSSYKERSHLLTTVIKYLSL
ncbi:single helix bin domain-containing protein [Trichomonas vaginalis G3]|uniref:single helix bin domain-containing protein n=1 Tax=Trichomonas vaginalis (strain ATCC PRA-98 / G3) TaxID=412133 RepID=UPI002156D0BD|nr:single helix bin domain-containing protein [Trichomonas vaginalis G3]KAI5482176.1 single helix bin domain-containing protein [Trichomonas vaginalis G3]